MEEKEIIVKRKTNTLKVISTLMIFCSIPCGIFANNFVVFAGVMALGLIGFMVSRFKD